MLDLNSGNRIVTLVILLCFAFCQDSPLWSQQNVKPPLPAGLSIRVLTYNIHHGRGTDDQIDLVRIAKVIKSARPDIVALQEVDNKTLRSGRVDQTAELARLVGMDGKFVHQIDYEGGQYGQAILSRFPISNLEVHWLPGTPDRERRIAGAASIRIGERNLIFVTTHLHHANQTFRQRQAEQLSEIFAADDAKQQTVILAGDLNATPESAPLQAFEKRWTSVTAGRTDALTFPASAPARQLDYILAFPKTRFDVIDASVIDESIASDHRPLVVELLLQE
jgi:endonuclease/exonuclease/phosphatase family metal-dependent hydrolase